jgi:hypothetical protein
MQKKKFDGEQSSKHLPMQQYPVTSSRTIGSSGESKTCQGEEDIA